MSISKKQRQESSQSGQASVEHAALVVVIGLLLVGGGAAIAKWSPNIFNAVNSGLRRAICVATGDSCAEFHVQKPCVIASTGRSQDFTVKATFIRVGRGAALVREVNSDGTVSVTVYDSGSVGAELTAGASLGASKRSRGDADLVAVAEGKKSSDGKPDRSIGGEWTATAGGKLSGGWGRTWVAKDGASADALIKRLVKGGDNTMILQLPRRLVKSALGNSGIPAAQIERIRFDADGTASAEGSGSIPGLTKLTLRGSALAGYHGEASYNRKTKEISMGISLPRGVAASLSGPADVELGGSLQVEPGATVVLDSTGRPKELKLSGQITTSNGSRMQRITQRIDLTRPEPGAAIRSLLASLRAGKIGQAVETASELGRWSVDEGAIDVSEYKLGETVSNGETEISAGAGIGLSNETKRSASTLIGQRSKPPGGVWEDRMDCEVPA